MNHETCTKDKQDEANCIYCPDLRECKKEQSEEVKLWLKHRLPS